MVGNLYPDGFSDEGLYDDAERARKFEGELRRELGEHQNTKQQNEVARALLWLAWNELLASRLGVGKGPMGQEDFEKLEAVINKHLGPDAVLWVPSDRVRSALGGVL